MKDVAEYKEKMYQAFGAICNMLFITMMSAANANLMRIPEEYPIFAREYASNMYGTIAYFLAKLAVEMPILAGYTLVANVMGCYMYDLQSNFFRFWMINYVGALCGSSMGVFLSSIGGGQNAVFFVVVVVKFVLFVLFVYLCCCFYLLLYCLFYSCTQFCLNCFGWRDFG